VILSHAPPCSCKSKEKEKEKKRNINNDLAVLPSHDTKLSAGSIVCQFTLFPSSNSMWYHSQLAFLTACSNFITIYPNLFQFILILFQF